MKITKANLYDPYGIADGNTVKEKTMSKIVFIHHPLINLEDLSIDELTTLLSLVSHELEERSQAIMRESFEEGEAS